MTSGFQAFPKIRRYHSLSATITEKIDGTNACIVFPEPEALVYRDEPTDYQSPEERTSLLDAWTVVQSRNRVITPGKNTDNQGFAAWVSDNIDDLYDFFGPGRHYGEWWGQGIQGNPYGIESRVFSPFNTHRFSSELWANATPSWPERVLPVPVLWQGPLERLGVAVADAMDLLDQFGSRLGVQGSKAEGCMIYIEGGTYFKVPFAAGPKTLQASQVAA